MEDLKSNFKIKQALFCNWSDSHIFFPGIIGITLTGTIAQYHFIESLQF